MQEQQVPVVIQRVVDSHPRCKGVGQSKLLAKTYLILVMTITMRMFNPMDPTTIMVFQRDFSLNSIRVKL